MSNIASQLFLWIKFSCNVYMCVCLHVVCDSFLATMTEFSSCDLWPQIYIFWPFTERFCWKWKSLSHVQVFMTPWTIQSMDSPGQNTGVGNLSLLQGIFPTQGSNPGLLHYRWILHQLSHQGSPRILEWVAYPFSSRSSRPRNPMGSPSLQVDSLPTELSGKPWPLQ